MRRPPALVELAWPLAVTRATMTDFRGGGINPAVTAARVRGERAGGLRSDAGQAAYWRMQWESCQEALAMVMAENTENVEALRDVVTDYGHACEHEGDGDCAMTRARRLVAHIPAPTADATPDPDCDAVPARTGGDCA